MLVVERKCDLVMYEPTVVRTCSSPSPYPGADRCEMTPVATIVKAPGSVTPLPRVQRY